MAGNFWSSAPETKRAYRWVVYINNIHTYMAKSVSKPTVSVSEISHRFINHTFWYPGRVEWNQVSVVLVDPVSPDAVKTVMGIIEAAGYQPPDNPNGENGSGRWPTIAKSSAVRALNGVSIEQVDNTGRMIEKWVLKNPWVKDASFGDLSYDNEDIMTVSLTLRYDWAYLETANPGHPLQGVAGGYSTAKRFPRAWNGSL